MRTHLEYLSFSKVFAPLPPILVHTNDQIEEYSYFFAQNFLGGGQVSGDPISALPMQTPSLPVMIICDHLATPLIPPGDQV